MKCKQVKKQLYLYAGNDLPQWKINKIKNHLHTCKTCSHELEQIKRYIGITIDSLKTEQIESDQQVLWQQIQDEIETASIVEEPGILNKIRKQFKSIFIKYTLLQSSKTRFALAALIVLALLTFSPFTLKKPEKRQIATNNQKRVSDLDKYPVVETVENRNVTVMTMQTDDPKIKVVWFFNEEFKL